MFRLAIKLSSITLLFVLAGLVFGSAKASAAQCNWAPGANWGINTGATNHGFTSMTVHAINGQTGKALNVSYKLNSEMERGYNYGSPPPGVPSSLYPNARIFHLNGAGNTDGRMSERWFGTGGVVDRIYANPSPSFTCDGWDQLGPGSAAQQGNMFVLDCQEQDVNGNLHSTRFWISSITTPSGIDGAYGGYWTVNVARDGPPSVPYPYPMDYNHAFAVVNGVNTRVDLVWHPNSHQDCSTNPALCGNNQAENSCTHLYAENVNTWFGKPKRTHVQVSNVEVGRIKVNDNPSQEVSHYQNIDQFVPDANGENRNPPPDYKTSKDWWYQPTSNNISVRVTVEAFNTAAAPGAWTTVSTLVNEPSRQCFAAHCDINVTGDGPGGIILAGGNMHFNGIYYNDSPAPDYLTIWWGALKDQGGGLHGINVERALGGGSYPFSFDIPAPGNITQQGWSFTPVYFGAQPIGPACTTTVKTFKPFNLRPYAEVQLTPTTEDPTNARFIGHADSAAPNGIPAEYSGGMQVNYSATSTLTPYGAGQQVLDSRNQSGPTQTPYTYNFTPPSSRAGDEYCLTFYLNEASGWVGPSNEFAYTSSFPSDGSANPSTACQHVYDKPYLRVYGADVVSGSNFKPTNNCNNNQPIRAYRSTDTANKSGSGVQFAALAFDQISGFGSADQRTSAPTWATGLTFGNETADISGTFGDDQPKDGGKYAGDPICARDYFDTLDTAPTSLGATTSPAALAAAVTAAGGKPLQFIRHGNLRINGGNFTRQAVVFVEGDVTITGNLTFSPRQYLAIFAKGDIRIDKSVTQLDGFYVAQPRADGTGGGIYTCFNASGGVFYHADDLYANCRNTLLVNGAFAAKSVKFLRVINSLRDSKPRESKSTSKGAEIFNFIPEIYLYTPVFDPGSAGNPYQYITTLPPVL